MIRSMIYLLFVSTVLFPLSSNAQKGKLEKMEKETQEGNSSNANNSGDNQNSNTYDDGNSFGELLLIDLGYAAFRNVGGILFKFRGEPPLLADIDNGGTLLSLHPYEDEKSGNYHRNPAFDPLLSRRELFLNYHIEGNDIYGGNLEFRYRVVKSFFAEVSYALYLEPIDGETDALHFYNISANYDRIRFTNWNLWWGVGLMGVNRTKNQTGFSFQVGTEIYPVKPIGISGYFRIAQIGETTTSMAQFRLNLHVRRFVPYTGFQQLQIGGISIRSFILGGGIYF